jgi:CDP-glycerol glycerophosphotransferase
VSADTVVFSSWHGRWSDSPRAISAELLRRGSPLQQVWVLAEVRRVAPDSPEELAALADARYVVSNDVLPSDWVKRPDCTYLQTWHGTPLKRIAFDVVDPRFPDAEYHYAVELGREVAKWDVLLSQNPFSTEILRKAFRFEGEILETGYPRNDTLRRPDRDAIRARVRAALELPEDTQAVLYVPTWRDSFEHTLALDLPLLRRELGDGTTMLVRAHGLTAHTDRGESGPGVRNVSRWPDVTELYLAADVLLTDYSSAMVDFAATGKPLLLYTHDLERYRDEIRGFTIAFEEEVPSPLLRTSAEVAAALADVPGATAPYRERYAAWAQRFCPWDDGGAARRVVDAVFGR